MCESGESLTEAALVGLLQATAPSVRRFLELRIPARLRSIITSEDLMQEVWIDAFQAVPRLPPMNAIELERWLTTVARRKLINAIRNLKRLKRGGNHAHHMANGRSSSSIRSLLAGVASPNRTPSSLVGSIEAADAISQAMSDLPQACKRAVWLRFIGGYSLDEVALRMHRTTNSVRGLIFRGLRQLKDRLGAASRFLSDAPSS